MILRCLLVLLTFPLVTAADEVPAHIKRGHLLAAFCDAVHDKKAPKVTAIYREIIPVAAPKSSYTTVAFTGGYVGLAGNQDGKGGTTINFSIWGKDAKELEPADKTHGIIKTRQFTHEGTGWAGRLAYPWKVGTRYQVYVHVKHQEGNTIYTAWFGEAAKGEWLLAGRTLKKGTHFLGRPGGFLEHAGTKDMEIRRCTGYGPSWLHDGTQWLPCTHIRTKLKDPDNARFYQKEGIVYLEIGRGIKSTEGDARTYRINPPTPEPPKLPEAVTALQ